MKVNLLYFGVTRDHAGKDTEALEFTSNQDVLSLRKALLSKYPALGQIQSFAIAVNESYATDETEVKDGDTVAVIPPVSGG